jgi:recombination protein RecR
MSKILPDSVTKLIEEFSKLPGVGPKTASRLVFYLLSKGDGDIKQFGQAILGLKEGLKVCPKCFNFTIEVPCQICQDPKRDQSLLMVVEEPLDIVAIEKTGFEGVYHVLGGVISPIDGIGPEHLRIGQLLEKINVDEIILATDPSLEGEATAMYIAKEISKSKIENPKLKTLKITRIARGLPVGGDLEYADEITLRRALEGRREY